MSVQKPMYIYVYQYIPMYIAHHYAYRIIKNNNNNSIRMK